MTTYTIDMQQARDAAADWTSNNPTLAAGVIGFESDTGNIKIGDGATAWTSLGYITGPTVERTSTPLSVVTPAFVGQRCVDTTADIAYVAVGLTSADWDELLTNSSGTTLTSKTTPMDGGDLVITYENGTDAKTVIPGLVALTTDATTNHAVVQSDHGTVISMTSGSANTVDIALNAATAMAIGSTFNVRADGAGATTIICETGITLDGVDNEVLTVTAGGEMNLLKTGTDAWIAAGDYTA